MKNEQQLDILLKQAVQEKFKDSAIHVPSSRPSWEKIEKALLEDKEVLYRRKVIINRMGWVAAIILVVLLSIGLQNNINAFTKFFHVLDGWKDDVIRIISSSPYDTEGQSLTAPPENPGEVITRNNNHERNVSLEEAQKLTSFAIKLPNITDDMGYMLTKITIWDNLKDKVRLEYVGENGSIIIMEELKLDHFDSYKAVDGDVKEIMIGENEAIMVSFDDVILLDWVDKHIAISIRGKLTESEIIDIAQSIR